MAEARTKAADQEDGLLLAIGREYATAAAALRLVGEAQRTYQGTEAPVLHVAESHASDRCNSLILAASTLEAGSLRGAVVQLAAAWELADQLCSVLPDDYNLESRALLRLVSSALRSLAGSLEEPPHIVGEVLDRSRDPWTPPEEAHQAWSDACVQHGLTPEGEPKRRDRAQGQTSS